MVHWNSSTRISSHSCHCCRRGWSCDMPPPSGIAGVFLHESSLEETGKAIFPTPSLHQARRYTQSRISDAEASHEWWSCISSRELQVRARHEWHNPTSLYESHAGAGRKWWSCISFQHECSGIKCPAATDRERRPASVRGPRITKI